MKWDEISLQEKEVFTNTIGDLRFWIARHGNEIRVAHKHFTQKRDQIAEITEPPSDITWTRWTFRHAPASVQILPAFPELAVIVKPEAAFKLTRQVKTRVFVRVPLWVRIQSPGKKSVILAEMPTVILSHTWFGTMTEGELCYWISSGIRPEIEPDPAREYLAICPVEIENKSDEELVVEKLCLRVNRLSIFEHAKQLWSDTYQISFQGAAQDSQIKITHLPPPQAPEARLLAGPRVETRKLIMLKSFGFLRELPTLGIQIS